MATRRHGDAPSVANMGRRDFLKLAGWGVALSAFGRYPFSHAAVAATPELTADHFVPLVKQLARGWVRRLAERGTPEIFSGKQLDSIGMPCGGIGTGQLYLCGDGTLGNWEIFNVYNFFGVGETSYILRAPVKPVSQGFAVTASAGATTFSRTLDRFGFADVRFRGTYPIGKVDYREDDAPVGVTLEAYSPFIPLNAKDSGLPATVFDITVRNTSRIKQRVQLSGWLENAVYLYSALNHYGVRKTVVENRGGRGMVLHSASDAPPAAPPPEARPAIVVADFEGDGYNGWDIVGDAFGARPAGGTLEGQSPVSGFLGKGLLNTNHRRDLGTGTITSPEFTVQRKYIAFLIGGGKKEKAQIRLMVDGRIVRNATGPNDEELRWHTWDVSDLEGKQARIQVIDDETAAWGHLSIDQIEQTDVKPAGTAFRDDLADFGTMALALRGEAPLSSASPYAPEDGLPAITGGAHAFPLAERRNGLLTTPEIELRPGKEHTFTVVLAWHFPNCEHGHEYAARFADAAEVANYVLDNYPRLSGETRLWRDTYYDSTLPYWLLDRLHSTLSYLATGTAQWWKNGRFWAWEGVVCCHGTCTHVWNYAHGHARLFPELARSVREMQDFSPRAEGGGFHPGTGLVGFRSDDSYAADGQCGTILKAYREHLTSADNAYLERNWPRIKKAMEFLIEQDANADGLIENLQHNTFDINFYGPNTFVGALYLAALRAAEEMAGEVGDTAFRERVRAIFESGRKKSIESLWNGEYFIQLVDLVEHPEHQYGHGCISDQVFGQGWAHQTGLGYLYPEEMVKSALQSVWRYNWAPDVMRQQQVHGAGRAFASPGEGGLFICTWPHSAYLDKGVLYRNEVWTGIEYQVAGHMAWEGMLDEALAICRAVHDRYHPLKRNPYNEVECGDHYARALASWGVFTALAGFEYNGPKGHIAFAPRITPENFQAAFTAAKGWGSYTVRPSKHGGRMHRIEVRWGTLSLNRVSVAAASARQPVEPTVSLGGRKLDARHKVDGKRICVEFSETIELQPGTALEILVG